MTAPRTLSPGSDVAEAPQAYRGRYPIRTHRTMAQVWAEAQGTGPGLSDATDPQAGDPQASKAAFRALQDNFDAEGARARIRVIRIPPRPAPPSRTQTLCRLLVRSVGCARMAVAFLAHVLLVLVAVAMPHALALAFGG